MKRELSDQEYREAIAEAIESRLLETSDWRDLMLSKQVQYLSMLVSDPKRVLTELPDQTLQLPPYLRANVKKVETPKRTPEQRLKMLERQQAIRDRRKAKLGKDK